MSTQTQNDKDELQTEGYKDFEQECKALDRLATSQEALQAYANPANWDGNIWIGEGSGGCWIKGEVGSQATCNLDPHPFMIAQEALKG